MVKGCGSEKSGVLTFIMNGTHAFPLSLCSTDPTKPQYFLFLHVTLPCPRLVTRTGTDARVQALTGLPSGAVSRADMGVGQEPTWLDDTPGGEDGDDDLVINLDDPDFDLGEEGAWEDDDDDPGQEDATVFVGADDNGLEVDLPPPNAGDELEHEFNMMLERMAGVVGLT